MNVVLMETCNYRSEISDLRSHNWNLDVEAERKEKTRLNTITSESVKYNTTKITPKKYL